MKSQNHEPENHQNTDRAKQLHHFSIASLMASSVKNTISKGKQKYSLEISSI